MNDRVVTLKYIWLDGYGTEPNIRSKTKYYPSDDFKPFMLSTVPEWSFDGSSTKQAEGNDSDCILKPVRVYQDTGSYNTYIVLCEVYNADGTPHKSNHRNRIIESEFTNSFWFGFEQEYTILDSKGHPYGLFDETGRAKEQGEYYCGVGYDEVSLRDLVEVHATRCFQVGINLTGTNAEVLKGQWEYQVFGVTPKKAADDLIVSRYLLFEISEKFKVRITLKPKPLDGDWNGAGLHVNFSNYETREVGGQELFIDICEKLRKKHKEHIAVYGSENDKRLTGKHETQHIDKFSYGVSDRGASIRIPVYTINHGWKGYLEDRRPAANANPYLVVDKIITTLGE